MKAKYQHIENRRSTSFSVEKFDMKGACTHEGLHFHSSYEIVFVKNGSGKIIVENKCQEYENGALIFLGPCLPHFSFSNNSFDDNYEIVIHFDEQFVDQNIRGIPEFSVLIPLIQKSAQVLIFDSKFKGKQATFFEEIYYLNPLEQLTCIFALLCKFHTAATFECLLDKPRANQYAHNYQFKKIFDFINKNYAQKISTRNIAQYLNLTTNSFCKIFKKITNKSFITYLNEYRVHRAVHLIEFSEDSISEIAYRCGFENLSYFSKVFFQVKSYTPNEYKKNYRLR